MQGGLSPPTLKSGGAEPPHISKLYNYYTVLFIITVIVACSRMGLHHRSLSEMYIDVNTTSVLSVLGIKGATILWFNIQYGRSV